MDTKRIVGFIFEFSINFQIIDKILKTIFIKFYLSVNNFGQSLNGLKRRVAIKEIFSVIINTLKTFIHGKLKDFCG